jgi:hypothetical protein
MLSESISIVCSNYNSIKRDITHEPEYTDVYALSPIPNYTQHAQSTVPYKTASDTKRGRTSPHISSSETGHRKPGESYDYSQHTKTSLDHRNRTPRGSSPFFFSSQAPPPLKQM